MATRYGVAPVGTSKRERQKAGRLQRLEAARAAQRRARRIRTIRNGVILVVVLVAVVVFLASRDGDDEVETTDTTTTSIDESTTTTGPVPEFTYGNGPCPAADGSSPKTITFAAPPQLCIDPAKSYTAVFDTSEGTVKVELDTATTPGTVNNFVVLARYHYYDGTDLFRTNTGIGIIQGGSPTTQASDDPGPGYDLLDEGFVFQQGGTGPYTYGPGDLVMARSSQPNGAGAQFFFGVDENVANLDGQGVYVKFGTVTEGLEVLQAILALHQPGPGGTPDEGAPSRKVTVNSVTIEEGPASG
jgi:cyclophilin family peptidyl-prolyl cis-trans isomerase